MRYPTSRYEKQLLSEGFARIAGVDEAGRGAWAGPLVAAAVILPFPHRIIGLNDSKKLSPARREQLYGKICAVAAWSVSIKGQTDIDAHGVGRMNTEALIDAVRMLEPKPDFVLVDALRITLPIPSKSIVHGDALTQSIAAASIIAKVTRDRLMQALHRIYPRYGFDTHKGYGTPSHARAIRAYGISGEHRRSFAPMRLMV